MQKQLIYYLTIVVLFISCTGEVNREELLGYVADTDNGLIQEKLLNGITYKLTYKPSDLLVWQTVRQKEKIEEQELQQQRTNFDHLYFTLSVSAGGKEVLNAFGGDKQKFGQLVDQLAFGMQDLVTLTNSAADTLQMMDAHFARTYGAARSSDVLLVFDKGLFHKNDQLKFTIEDFGLRTGRIIFRFETNDIINTPNIDFNKLNN